MTQAPSRIGTKDSDQPNTHATATMKRLARRGVVWVTLVSVAGVPIAYYRNWILGRIGDDGTVLGTYVVVLLLLQIVTTFVLFGGSSVVTNYLPKLEERPDKSRFLASYATISLLAVLVFVTMIQVFPASLEFLVRREVDEQIRLAISVLSPIVVAAQIVLYFLAGLMEFRFSSVLAQTQVFFISVVGTLGLFAFQEAFANSSLLLLAGVVCLANVMVVAIGGAVIARRLSPIALGFQLPCGFWRFSGFVHLNTVTTFAYRSIDQICVLAVLGTAELGAYFVLLQYAQLITFVPQRIGQVMLASFSHLIAADTTKELRLAYVKLCRSILILSTGVALVLILFSRPLAAIFGDWAAERHGYLIFLAVAIHLGSLGSVNSMLIMAKERTGLFLANNVTLIIIQLVVTLTFLDRLGVMAVILGKACGILSGQIGLFAIVGMGFKDLRLRPPHVYWLALGTVLASAAAAYLWRPLQVLPALGVLSILGGGFLLMIRFRFRELAEFRPRRLS